MSRHVALADLASVLPAKLFGRTGTKLWSCAERKMDGALYEGRNGLRVIVSKALEKDGRLWLHLSFSRRDRIPTWSDLQNVRAWFVGDNRKAIMVFPRLERYINIHPNCLHLFVCLEAGVDPIPDFDYGGITL